VSFFSSCSCRFSQNICQSWAIFLPQKKIEALQNYTSGDAHGSRELISAIFSTIAMLFELVIARPEPPEPDFCQNRRSLPCDYSGIQHARNFLTAEMHSLQPQPCKSNDMRS